jgi:SNF2 family DNA or RNA helicase
MATAGIVSGRDSGMAGGVQTDGNQKGGPAENARALSSTRFFLAQYSGGACFGCPRRIVKNEPVCYVNGRLCHVECLEKVAQIGEGTRADVSESRAESLSDKFVENSEEYKKTILAALKEGNIPLEFQWVTPAWIEKLGNKALVGDEMGLGKTISTILWLARHPEARPAFVFCPNSVKLNWRREIKRWLKDTGKKQPNHVFVLNGQTPVKLPAYGIYVCNYDIATYWRDEIIRVNPQTIICDEVHYLKTPKAKRTIAILGPMGSRRDKIRFIAKDAPNIIALSGTPLTNRPVELFPILHTLRPQLFPSYMEYVRRYCAAYPSRYGLIVSGASNIPELADLLRTYVMLRRTKAQVLSDLPEKRRSLVPLPISNKSEYEFAKKDLIAWLRSQDKDITGALKAEALVKFEKLKQLAAHGKLNASLEWINDFLETGQKLVVAVHHKDIGARVLAAVKKYNPVAISGGDTADQRQKAIDSFQNDPKCQIVVVSITAGSTGITLHAANSIATLELGWTPSLHSQMEDRLHRIGQKSAVTAYYLLAADTIEERIASIIDKKAPVIKGVLGDGDSDGDMDILGSVVTEFMGHAK